MSIETRQKGGEQSDFGEVLAPLPETFSATSVGNSIYSTVPKTVRDVHEIDEVTQVSITLTSEGWFVKPVSDGGVDE